MALSTIPPLVQDWIRGPGTTKAAGAASPPPKLKRPPTNGHRAESAWLVTEALRRAPKDGRNDAGFWLAMEMRDNGYTQREALGIGQSYVGQVSQKNTKGQPEPYTLDEFRKSAEQAYSQPPRDPIQRGFKPGKETTERAEPAGPSVGENPQEKTESAFAVPKGFQLRSDGLYRSIRERDNDEEKFRFVCSPIEVVCRTRDQQSNDWGKLVRFSDHDGKAHEYVMPESLMASRNGDWLSQLTARGLYLNDAKYAREDLKSYLNNSKPAARARKVDQIGWHGTVFVTPAWTEPADLDERVVLDDQGTGEHFFNQKGSLDDWRNNVASLCPGNPLLILAVSAAFAPVLLKIQTGMGGGFHFASNSSTGKSTTLIVAGSVWGGGGKLGFGQSWNATANGIEAMAQAHNHCLLCLDEIKELPAEQAGRVAYELANGQGRARMMRDTRRGKRASWELIFLSTGEFGFIAHIESGAIKGRDRAYAGQEVRVCELPFGERKYGGFDELHGARDGAEFARRLVDSARKDYGFAGREFVAQMMKRGFDQTGKQLVALMDDFPYDLKNAKVDPAVNRVLQRFAFIGAAGELATKWGVTGWEAGKAESAASTAFSLWLSKRGTFGSFDDKRALDHIKRQISSYGESKFVGHKEGKVTDADGPRPLERWGFRGETADDTEFQFVDQLPQNFCSPFDPETLIRAADSCGALVKDSGHKTTKRVIPFDPTKPSRMRCFVISKNKLFESDKD